MQLINSIYMRRGLWLPMAAALILGACNSKPEDEPFYEESTAMAVTKFYLKSDKKVLSNLDSVYFTIDLKEGIVFNADSLPKGTDISKLIPIIQYSSGVQKAEIEMIGGDVRSGKVDYMANPQDSIDFTGIVTLHLTAQNAEYSRDYRLKVNVHNMDPDTLWWDKLGVAELPSRKGTPKEQRTVEFNGLATTLINEADGSFTLASIANPAKGEWIRSVVAFPFTPQTRTLTAAGSNLFILSDSGDLYSSADGMNWTSTGSNWISVLGAYGNTLLGLRSDNGRILHTSYPADTYPETEAAADFPVSGASNMMSYTSKWVRLPMTIVTGGRDSQGNLLDGTWSFNGVNWGCITADPHPALEGASIVPYFVYRREGAIWKIDEYSVWFLIGGRLDSGELNHNIYISYDNGVNWQKSATNFGFPDYVPAMMNLDALSISTQLQGSFNPGTWDSTPSKEIRVPRTLDYTINGYDVTWECPYIYLFGGCNASGTLYNTIWKGVINRLTFVPLF